MSKLNPTLHQNLRLAIISYLATVESTEFKKLLEITESTKGNLSAQLSKLEAKEYIIITKSFRGKYPLTECSITDKGQNELKKYISQLKSMLNI